MNKISSPFYLNVIRLQRKNAEKIDNFYDKSALFLEEKKLNNKNEEFFEKADLQL